MPTTGEKGSDQISYLADLTRRIAGFDLEKERSLISDPRMMDLLLREQVGTVEELVGRLRVAPEGPLHQNVVESLAVGDTFFFRDNRVFDAIEKSLIPWFFNRPRPNNKITLWSAGCSTGQEAYSLAMAAEEALESDAGWTYTVMGTDLSSRNIRTAEMGAYSQFDINCGLPASRLVRYFKKNDDWWRVRENLKKSISFKKLNLADPSTPFPTIDLVLIRNVLSYFGASVRHRVLEKIRAALRPDGFLVLGEGESVSAEEGFTPFHNDRVTIYRPHGEQFPPPKEFSI